MFENDVSVKGSVGHLSIQVSALSTLLIDNAVFRGLIG